jgi:hypothetical protein
MGAMRRLGLKPLIAATFLSLLPFSASSHDSPRDEVGCHAQESGVIRHCHGFSDEMLP